MVEKVEGPAVSQLWTLRPSTSRENPTRNLDVLIVCGDGDHWYLSWTPKKVRPDR